MFFRDEDATQKFLFRLRIQRTSPQGQLLWSYFRLIPFTVICSFIIESVLATN